MQSTNKSQIGQIQQSTKKRGDNADDKDSQNIPLVFIKSPRKNIEETIIASGADADSLQKHPAGEQDLADASLNQRQDPGSLTLT